MLNASSAERTTNVPRPPKPSIRGTIALDPSARISRSYGSRSPVPSSTSLALRSMRVARVFSHVSIRRSSYQASGLR